MNIPEGPFQLAWIPEPVDPAAPTLTELQCGVPLLHYWRSEPDECEHGATLTAPIAIVEPVSWDPTRVREVGRTTEPITYCLVCHQLVSTPEDQP